MPIINSLAEIGKDAAQWRHALHENPQTMYEETFANNLIKEKLTEWGIPFKDGLGVTGIAATITGQKDTSGKSIGLRADMDALNITEETGLPHASKTPGKMHACGHDGHTATLLAAAKYLNDTKNFNGKVHLIFQPAEEGGRGSHSMMDDGLLDQFDCDYIFGLHNWPYLKKGEIATRTGPLLAGVDEFEIYIKGKGGHAAMPHVTKDPIIVATHLINALQTIVSRNVDPIDTAVLSITNINVGTGAVNIIAEKGKIEGTVRTFSHDLRMMIKDRIEQICEHTAAMFGATIEIDYDINIDPTVNSADGVDMVYDAAGKVVDAKNVDRDCAPCMGGEDFGGFMAVRPGAFILVGQAVDEENSPHNQGLHTPQYDFNDDIIPIGASLFATLVEDYLTE
ncbi:MAG: M20 aminoacylase family protein [Alphaproteobacteria bacterium]|nr:M20 aminoacylase family protein [Alphaproteobacteria bacterium]MDP7223264.1 M20 aminoacylase family protein [Alphaproteobacteria bacterium]